MTTQTETPPATTVSDNDMQRLAELATLITAAQDAMSDEIVTRLASAMSEGLTLLDRLTRNEGLVHLLKELDRPENQHFLISLSNAFTEATRDIATAAPSKGGVTGILRLACEPGTQEGLRLVSLIGQHLSESMREMHRRGS
ncbi:hypothetical protein MNBD_GAMMA14-2087 [hydrothermal vent metagenome]|uniref:DUF1641 domain-containing protein n=1 Tax=hydrothermal vent metagenome TaxID=652676 RepID=A0A3B0Z8W8_9ZZZZ